MGINIKIYGLKKFLTFCFPRDFAQQITSSLKPIEEKYTAFL